MSASATLGQSARAILADDPYRIDELARLMLLGLLPGGEREETDRGLAILGRLRIGRYFRTAIEAVRQQQAELDWLDGVFYLSEPAHNGTLLHTVHSAVQHHLKAARVLFRLPLPLLLVDLRNNTQAISLTIHEIEGLGQILLAGNCPPAERSATLAHELFHSLFRCGNRFLDEGLAVHFEARRCPEHCFPLPRKRFAELLDTAPQCFSLRELIECEPERTRLQGGLAGTQEEKQLVYVQAWRLIDDWFNRFGLAGTLAACRKLAEAGAKQREQVFQSITGQDWAGADQALFGNKTTFKTAWNLDLIEARLAAGQPFPELEEALRWLRQQAADGERRARRLLARQLLLPALERQMEPAAQQAAVREAVPLLEAAERDGEDGPEHRLQLAWLATLQALLTTAPEQIWLANQAACQRYREALTLAPDHVETLHSAGIFFSHMPASLGGDPAFARQCFEQAARLRSVHAAAVRSGVTS
ncbi:hypothetical protein [Chitinimonas lacunae]|uniref:Peptidase M48 domain-containing protein n=1 Tax=Chitinimonas lacunae TaxID=1963018 RepID=A0ABV8MPE3_9NEIS